VAVDGAVAENRGHAVRTFFVCVVVGCGALGCERYIAGQFDRIGAAGTEPGTAPVSVSVSAVVIASASVQVVPFAIIVAALVSGSLSKAIPTDTRRAMREDTGNVLIGIREAGLLLEHGLLRGSFVPATPLRELRALTRYRKATIQDQETKRINRLYKVLEDTGIKLGSVASNVLGMSGRAMLAALIAGTTDPDAVANLARGKLRQRLPALRQALAGRFQPHHGFLLTQLLAHIDEQIETLTSHVHEVIAPFAAEVDRLDTIRGTRAAQVIIAELGVDMAVFPSAHAASWAGLGPGNNENAGEQPPRGCRGAAQI